MRELAKRYRCLFDPLDELESFPSAGGCPEDAGRPIPPTGPTTPSAPT